MHNTANLFQQPASHLLKPSASVLGSSSATASVPKAPKAPSRVDALAQVDAEDVPPYPPPEPPAPLVAADADARDHQFGLVDPPEDRVIEAINVTVVQPGTSLQ